MRAIHTLSSAVLLILLAPASIASAQEAKPASAAPVQASPISDYTRHIYDGAAKILLRAAADMPEEKYAFKPVEGVRTFGQTVGHVADSQYRFCAIVLGEKNPSPKVEKTKVTKAELIAALQESIAYCGRAYAGMTDVSAAEMVKFGGSDVPKLGVLGVNNVHSIEHYGNMVTHLRMNGLVPPTSDPEFMKSLR